MPKSDTLIRTKLRLPFIRQQLVTRPRLQERVAQGLRGPLTLIAAPAGFGKTTLVAAAVSDSDLPMAWVSLDRDDNEIIRFLAYLVAALQAASSAVGEAAAELLETPRGASSQAIMTSLVNDLDVLDGDLVLVLDDYHAIHSPPVHEAVAFLLEHCPRTLHLVIATRADPPLPLARLRARGQIAELRAADLSFTETEAAEFLNSVMGLSLDAEAVRALEARTEGWIAGLQMAALSMQGHKDIAGFIQGFAGTHRYILDYLLEEVLARQSPEVQEFMLRTSILARLSAPLCEAVLAGDHAESQAATALAEQSGTILAHVEMANLFLLPLDDERSWYRYHHLFADLLQAQLRRSHNPEDIARLHLRASEWHAKHGSLLEAINHAAAASDDARVEHLIRQTYAHLVRGGELSWLRSWTGRLSEDLVTDRPWLCAYKAYSHSWFGELDEADRLLNEAEQNMSAEIPPSEIPALQRLIAYVRSRVTAIRGDIPRAIELCLAAREGLPEENLPLQLDTRITLGYEYFLIGDYVNAEPILQETVRLGTAAGALTDPVAAAALLARLHAIRGRLQQSLETYERAAAAIRNEEGQHLGTQALVEVGIADVLAERNQLEPALARVQEGLVLMPHWDKADDWVLAYATLARIHLAQGALSEAAETVERARRIMQTRGGFSEARQAFEVIRSVLWLVQGDLDAASHWAAALERPGANELTEFELEPARIAAARVGIAQERYQAARVLLSKLETTVRAGGRTGRLIQILLLKALALQGTGDAGSALRALEESLSLAAPEGYARVYLDEGQPMRMLLAEWAGQAGQLRAGDPMLVDYAASLLSQFDAEVVAPPARDTETGGLIEPLSPRELEVLQLMALGATNKAIAEQLFVAAGTVKAHTASIYRKLDVANRTEAAARARELGILA